MREVVVVSGASGGIGTSICHRLGADGFDVVAQYHRDTAKAERLRSTLEQRGIRCHLFRVDLTDPAGIDALVSYVRELTGGGARTKVRALVNNAAKLLGPSLQDATPHAFDEYVALNLKAPFFLTQGIAALMGSGASVVNISSASAHIASAGDIVYAMTKTGIESLTKNMGLSLAPRGIRVNAVVPGFTDNGNPAFSDTNAVKYMSDLSALGGIADPGVVADAVSFLISDAARRTTGALLDVTGGMTLNPRRHGAGSVRELM